LNLPLIVGVIVLVVLALLGLVGYLIDRSAERHDHD
jgi:Tfp pilus assembly protein PilX